MAKNKNKLTKKQAQDQLYSMWQDGELPQNFTEEHSRYDEAVEQLMELGHLIWEDFF